MMLFDHELLTSWISQHSDWALVIVFAIAFAESLAVIGLLIPGWLLLVGVGVLIGTGNINFYLASLSCFFGAVLGESMSYLIGVHYQEQVHHWKIFKRHPQWMKSTEHFFSRYGIASIALGRFVGPVRAFVPLMAGMTGMNNVRFQITNILSAMVWAPTYLVPGVILGASVNIDETVRWILLSNIALIVISAWTSVSLLNSFLKTTKRSGYLRIKLLLSLIVFSLSLSYIIWGPENQQVTALFNILIEIVNQ